MVKTRVKKQFHEHYGKNAPQWDEGDVRSKERRVLLTHWHAWASLINRHGPLESFPPDVLEPNRELALIFKTLATLRTDAPLFSDVEELRWRGTTEAFPAVAERIADARLAPRVAALEAKVAAGT